VGAYISCWVPGSPDWSPTPGKAGYASSIATARRPPHRARPAHAARDLGARGVFRGAGNRGAPLLLAVPNVSEGRDAATIAAIGRTFAGGDGDDAVRLLDVHADPDHHRAVFTLAGRPGALADALARGAAEAVRQIDVGAGRGGPADPARGPDRARHGQHPHVGAVDVVPVVYLDAAARGAACAAALVAAHAIGASGVPVLLYGLLAGGRTRAQLRRGGVAGLAQRLADGELRPDFGPRVSHPRAGVTLVAARAPLVAFNLELAPPAGVREARAIAALIREGGAQGLPGVRALGIELRRAAPAQAREAKTSDPKTPGHSRAREGAQNEHTMHDRTMPVGARAGGGVQNERTVAVGQVSTNVERPDEVPLAAVVAAVARHARVARAELVGLAPRAALEGFPQDLPMPGFDPARHVIENALARWEPA
jgi:glutamate formiminotransferase